MYLKALEIQGFKSFPEKTRLTFEKDITAIVGPNGSGKSNISDAILWVMGEQRTRALRGGKMEDVIFGGTEKRSPLGFAQVTLMIDNEKGIFDSESSEIMISRRYYRSGESEYYLNRQSVRLKDITELLMDTGLGRYGYSIIGQGRIADIVSAKNTDRREIFEEAAGISRFRVRKEEAERKLQRTGENLLRINDKIDELEMQVEPLRQQSETAKKYLALRDQLKSLEVSVWMENLDRLKGQSQAVTKEYEQARSALSEAHRELEAVYARAENMTEKIRERDLEMETTRDLLGECEQGASECESLAAVLESNIQNNKESMEQLRREQREQDGRAGSLAHQIGERGARISGIDKEKTRYEADVDQLLAQVEESSRDADGLAQKLARLVGRESQINQGIAQGETMLSMLTDAREELSARAGAGEREIKEVRDKKTAAAASLDKARAELQAAKARRGELLNVISGYRLRLSGREARLRQLTDKQTQATIDLKSMESRIAMLTEMEKEYEGYPKAVKTVMRAKVRTALKGIHGPVANLLKTEDQYTLAIETALGGAAQSVVVDTPEDGKAAIELLKAQDGGRGTFLPLSVIRGKKLGDVPRNEPGCLGTALELTAFDGRYQGIFENLLGRTVITETLGDAVRISRRYKNRFRIVSLDGQVVNQGGSMTGGSAARNTGILSRANELKNLALRREGLKAAFEQGEGELRDARRELEALQYELEVAQAEADQGAKAVQKCDSLVSQGEFYLASAVDSLKALEMERTQIAKRLGENEDKTRETKEKINADEKSLAEIREQIACLSHGRAEYEKHRADLTEKLSAIREAIASLDAERRTTRSAMEQLEALRTEISGDTELRLERLAELERKNQEAAQRLEEKRQRLSELSARAGELKEWLARITGLRLELEANRTALEKSGQEKNKDLLEMERLCARLEQKKLSVDLEEKQIIDKLWDTYELSHSAALKARTQIESLSRASRRISEIKRDISTLGHPNIGAIEEFERVNARYTFLTDQRDDVEKAKKELLSIIFDITSEMEEIFVREFNAISESFRTTFIELFGGGRASLALDDESDVLGCGVEIKVQPPGKQLSTISLLSGGEMAFVAIALYFAILKVRPTPFCVMDEIEAALDETNVIRFAETMRGMSRDTQFVVITHRRGTMEEADMLYGVTMQEKGVSSIISVDLQEAEKTIA